jgi:nicotinamidase-related amidase
MLILVDVQGNLAQSMNNKEELFKNLENLVSGVLVLGIPIIWTEQNPQRLGPTIPEIAKLMAHIMPVSKMSFSCCGNERFLEALKTTNRKQVLLAGIEAHICIYQTAVDLLALGYEVHIIADGVSSRTPENKMIALGNMKDAGARLTTTEMLLFSLLKTAEAPQFKEIVKLVR